MTELVLLLRVRQAQLSKCIFFGGLYANNNILCYSTVVRTITGELGYWREERSLEPGKKRGNSRGLGPAGYQAAVVLQLTVSGEACQWFSKCFGGYCDPFHAIHGQRRVISLMSQDNRADFLVRAYSLLSSFEYLHADDLETELLSYKEDPSENKIDP